MSGFPPIVVMGLARGGTSAVTGVIQLGGAEMANGNDGYYEDFEMHHALNSGNLAEVVNRKRLESPVPWGWKDPTLFNEWDDSLQEVIGYDAKYVVVFRNPTSIAKSIFTRENSTLDLEILESHCTNRYKLLVEWAEGHECISLCFEDLISNPKSNITDLWNKLELSFDKFETAVEFIRIGTYSNLAQRPGIIK